MIRLPHLFPRCPLGGSPTPTENYCPTGPGYPDSYRCFWAHCSPKPHVLPLCRPRRVVASPRPLCICCSLYLKALLPISNVPAPSFIQFCPAGTCPSDSSPHPHTFYPKPSPAFLHRTHYLALSLCPPLDCRLHQDRFCLPCSLLSPWSPHSAWVRHSGRMGRRRMANTQQSRN